MIVRAALFSLLSLAAFAQNPSPPSLAERLGHPADAKLLIIHADDLGMTHSVNAASIRAFETGAINSASIMVPCPWFPEIAAWARENAEADLGLHLTLTSEWPGYRWGPVLPASEVPSLLDSEGYFYRTEAVAAERIDPREAEAEIRAQIERAIAFGIRPTHLDSHMRTLHQNAELFAVQMRVSREYGIPAAVPRAFLDDPELAPVLRPGDLVIDRFISIGSDAQADQWEEFYTEAIRSLEPGVTELIVHLAYDDEEMRAATNHVPAWGSAWRQRDFEFLGTAEFRGLLAEHDVRLVTWGEIQKLMPKP